MRTAEPQTSSTDYPGLPKALSLLVVEDETRLRDLLRDVARDMGFETAGVRSAEEALRLLNTEPKHLLIVDLNLPGIGGIDFIEQAKARWPETQMIILTGFGTLETARRAIHLDVVEFLTKPSPLSEVERALDRARRRIDEIRARQLPTPTNPEPPPTSDQPTLADQERQIILTALQRNNGNRTQTALALGISRRTLHSRLQQYQQAGWQTP
jgi:DNA-binding NtrC family response regulator